MSRLFLIIFLLLTGFLAILTIGLRAKTPVSEPQIKGNIAIKPAL